MADLGFKGFSDDEILEELQRRGLTVSDDAGRLAKAKELAEEYWKVRDKFGPNYYDLSRITFLMFAMFRPTAPVAGQEAAAQQPTPDAGGDAGFETYFKSTGRKWFHEFEKADLHRAWSVARADAQSHIDALTRERDEAVKARDELLAKVGESVKRINVLMEEPIGLDGRLTALEILKIVASLIPEAVGGKEGK